MCTPSTRIARCAPFLLDYINRCGYGEAGVACPAGRLSGLWIRTLKGLEQQMVERDTVENDRSRRSISSRLRGRIPELLLEAFSIMLAV